MRLLLDTNSLLFASGDPARLSVPARDAFLDVRNVFFLSTVTPWEIATKSVRGKLALGVPFDEFIATQVANFSLTLIPVTLQHVSEYEALPLLHRDPFDRMLIAQAISEGLTIITSDRTIPTYDVPTLW